MTVPQRVPVTEVREGDHVVLAEVEGPVRVGRVVHLPEIRADVRSPGVVAVQFELPSGEFRALSAGEMVQRVQSPELRG